MRVAAPAAEEGGMAVVGYMNAIYIHPAQAHSNARKKSFYPTTQIYRPGRAKAGRSPERPMA